MDSEKPCLSISGAGAEAVREALLVKLVHPVVVLRPFRVETGGAAGEIDHAVSLHDSADFAAEKILDTLADCGWIQFSGESLTAAEEGDLRRRLLDLGYIE
jgi:hypothetical protein